MKQINNLNKINLKDENKNFLSIKNKQTINFSQNLVKNEQTSVLCHHSWEKLLSTFLSTKSTRIILTYVHVINIINRHLIQRHPDSALYTWRMEFSDGIKAQRFHGAEAQFRSDIIINIKSGLYMMTDMKVHLQWLKKERKRER